MVVPEVEKNTRVVQPSDAVARWRADMESADAKQQLRARASLVELANGQLKSRLGLGALLVRSVNKVTCVALLSALAGRSLPPDGRADG